MRISDWSSDVCSSDLADSVVQVAHQARTLAVDRLGLAARPQLVIGRAQFGLGLCHAHAERHRGAVEFAHRTDETQRHQPGNGEKEAAIGGACAERSEEHTSELPSLMRTSCAGFCLK